MPGRIDDDDDDNDDSVDLHRPLGSGIHLGYIHAFIYSTNLLSIYSSPHTVLGIKW